MVGFYLPGVVLAQATANPESTSFLDSGLGTLTVALVLIVLAVVFFMVRRNSGETKTVEAPRPVSTPEADEPAVQVGHGLLDAKRMAIIAAAAYAAVGRPVRLLSISRSSGSWSSVGRISVQSSHNIRRNI